MSKSLHWFGFGLALVALGVWKASSRRVSGPSIGALGWVAPRPERPSAHRRGTWAHAGLFQGPTVSTVQAWPPALWVDPVSPLSESLSELLRSAAAEAPRLSMARRGPAAERTDCGRNAVVQLYRSTASVLPEHILGPGQKGTVVGLYEPDGAGRGIDVIALADGDPEQLYLVTGHEVAHYWYHRACGRFLVKESSEDFAQAIERGLQPPRGIAEQPAPESVEPILAQRDAVAPCPAAAQEASEGRRGRLRPWRRKRPCRPRRPCRAVE